MRAFRQQVQVEIRKDGWEAVRILKIVLPGRIGAQAIGEQRLLAREDRFEKAVRVDTLERYNVDRPRSAHHPGVTSPGQVSANGYRRPALHLDQVDS